MNALFSIFANPWILAWLPLAAVPLLIHLWSRRRYREAPWAAMEYLLAAIRQSSRRMRIEQLLLLLIRTAVVLLVVFALAKPLLRGLSPADTGGRRIHHVFVIDASLSMQYQPADRSLFDIARDQAAATVSRSGQGDGFSLVLLSDPPRVVVGKAVFDPLGFQEELAALEPTDGGGDLPATLAAVERVVAEARREQPQLAFHTVTLFTDLARTTWDAAGRDTETEEVLLRRIAALGERGTLEVVPLGRGSADNLAVTELSIAEPFATIRQPVLIQAVAHNFGGQQQSQQSLELRVNGRRVETRLIDLPAGESSAPVVFRHVFTTPGDHAVEVALSGDSLPADNRRRLAVPVRPHLEVLLIEGKRGASEPPAFALETDYRYGSRAVRPEVAGVSALLDSDLSRYDCIFLCNVAQFTAAEAQVLQSYLQQGGGLVFFLGDQVLPERYNQELAGEGASGVHVLPARLGEAVAGEPLGFDPLEYRHPLIEVWRGQLNTGLLSARTWKYFPLEPIAPRDERIGLPGRTALAFTNGRPAIVEASLHNGRSIVVATAASPESLLDAESRMFWSDIFRPERIAPLGQELWRFAVGSRLEQRNVLVGQPLAGPLASVARDSAVRIYTPRDLDDELEPRSDAAPPRAAMEIGSWTFDATRRAGWYRGQIENLPQAELFAVNIDPRQSDPARIDPRDLPEGLSAVTDWDAASEQPLLESAAVPSALHKGLLVAVLLLLLTESAFAWWLGSRGI